MSERLTIFAQILLPLPVPKTYTYRVPHEWNDSIEIGQRVTVQFGPRKLYAGIVVDLSDSPPEGYQASYVLEMLDEQPVVSPAQLRFWDWISNYYLCHPGEVMAAALPAGFRLQSESVVMLSPDFDEELIEPMDETEWELLKLLMDRQKIRLDEASKILGLKSIMKYVKSLYQRGYLLMQEEVKERYRPKTETFLKLSADWGDETFARQTLDQLEKRAPKQAAAVMAIMGIGKGELGKKQLIDAHGIDNSHIQSLSKKGLIQLFKKEIGRLKITGGHAAFELTPAQIDVCSKIETAFSNKKPAVLHGVTGSGKTFVYQHFMRKALDAGKQVLYLVPEVGLTEQLVSRLSTYFGDNLGVWHNYYSSDERTELYYKIKNKTVNLIVGPRSAVFAPMVNPGLIVVDEEHENSFKQFEKRPHYHGRDAALHAASMWKCNIILGSATPSYELLHACEEGKMERVELNERFLEARPPEIELVNVAVAKQQNRMRDVFSLHMLEEIQSALDKKFQVIVFQNRKGYVPFISCNFCGYTTHCINCDISLTYYKSLGTQKCSYCGYTREPLHQCPDCGSTSLSMRGFGTERIAEELGIHFPEARITRFDQESVRKRSDFQKILGGFENGDIDILVGTQLLSKGLDFKNVGLVCIPDADLLLNIPEFRSHERAFQQMHQVAGRAGRGSKQGKVLIQSYQTSHPVLLAVQENDFYGLAESELGMRKALQYPPYSRIIKVLIRHKDARIAEQAARVFADGIRTGLAERVLGPQAPVVARIRNYFIQQIMVKMDLEKDNVKKIKKYLGDSALRLHAMSDFKGVWVDFDVDPV